MVQVAWSRRAAADLAAIRAYIRQDRPIAAGRMAQRLIQAGTSLKDMPDRGRPASGGARELAIIYPYIIRYVVRPDGVRIVRIKHGAQRL